MAFFSFILKDMSAKFGIRFLDYRLNSGDVREIDLPPPTRADYLGVWPKPPLPHLFWGSPPFTEFRVCFRPSVGAAWFCIYHIDKLVVSCSFALEKASSQWAWDHAVKRLNGYAYGDPSILEPKHDISDPERPPFYLKNGCPDLIHPGVEIIQPERLPFLATVVVPPWHRRLESETVRSALRFREVILAHALEGDYLKKKQPIH